jgi:hypothetical protein
MTALNAPVDGSARCDQALELVRPSCRYPEVGNSPDFASRIGERGNA